MKILFWIESFLPDLGGMQWSIYRLARALKNGGHKIIILTRESAKKELVNDFSIIRLPGKNTFEWTLNSGRWLKENSNRFDVIQTVDLFYQAIEPQLDILKTCGKPSVLKIPTAGYVPKLINSGELFKAFQSIGSFIALNDLILNELIGVGAQREKIFCIPNGVDCEEFFPSLDKTLIRKSLGLPSDKFLVIFAGRFVERKRLDILLAAIKLTDANVHLVMVGSGFGQRDSNEERLMNEVENLEKVTIVRSTDNCLPYFQAGDAQILLSEREGMPNSLLEGMACSLPTIATSISGIIDLITDGLEGFLVPVGKIQETANAINSLARNNDTRISMGSFARSKIMEKFNVNNIAKQYELLYRNLKE